MEQTNLVVTPDGQTWDEVTRDTSYIGNTVFKAKRDGGHVNDAIYIWDIYRGPAPAGQTDLVQKNIAISHDRQIFLESGEYQISGWVYTNAAYNSWYVMKNTTTASSTANAIYNRFVGSDGVHHWSVIIHMKRGDYLACVAGDQSPGIHGTNPALCDLTIKKL